MSQIRESRSDLDELILQLNTVTECDEAATKLASLGVSAAPALRRFLFEGHPSVVYQPRRAAVEALSRIGAKDVLVQYLTWNKQIDDAATRFGEECVQNAAARELAKFETRDVFDVLLTFAVPHVRPGIVEALAKFGSVEVIPYLLRSLEDDLCEQAATEGLRTLGPLAELALITAALTPLPSSEEERPSSVRRRTKVLQLLVEGSVPPLSEHCWPLLKPLWDEEHPEIVVQVAKLALTSGSSDDRRTAAKTLIDVLPRTDWFLRGEIEGCLLKLHPDAETEIEEEFAKRNVLSKAERITDPTFRTLQRVRRRIEGLQEPER